MTEAPVTIKGMSLEEFIRRSEQEGPFELINGEIIPKMPTVYGHNISAKRIFVSLLPYEQQGLGEVFQEATFVLSDIPNGLRVHGFLMFCLSPGKGWKFIVRASPTGRKSH